MIKNMIDSRRVLGADATTDTEGVARRQAVSGFPPESRLRKATGIFKFHHRQQVETRDFLLFLSLQRLTKIRRFYLLPNVDVGEGIRFRYSPLHSRRLNQESGILLVSRQQRNRLPFLLLDV